MPPRPWLSVLVPFRNVRPYLRQCLTSVLDQVDDGVELVLVDDASDDGSASAIEDILSSGRVTLLTNRERQGVAAARNALLEHAHGDYLWFVDSDDWVAPGAVGSLRRIVAAHGPDLVLCDFRTLVETPSWRARLRWAGQRRSFRGTERHLVEDRSQLVQGLFEAGYMQMWSKIVRRQVWNGHLRFPLRHSMSDVRVSSELALSVRNFYYEPVPWVTYRRSGQSLLATTHWSQRADDRANALEGMAARLAALGPLNDDARRALAHYAARNFVLASRLVWRKEGDRARPRLRQYRHALERESPVPAEDLSKVCLERGEWAFAIVLQRWLARARG